MQIALANAVRFAGGRVYVGFSARCCELITSSLSHKQCEGRHPGQTPSKDLALDGVPGKGGMIQKQEPLKGLGQSGKQKVQSYKDYLNAKKS